MDDEKLIEFVRQHVELYDLSHSKYMDGNHKEKIWTLIGKHLNQPVATCKTRWNNIRDNFRKSLKRRVTKSRQAAAKVNKYKFEKQLQFLLPYLKERETISNIIDEENETEDEKLVRKEKFLENDNDQQSTSRQQPDDFKVSNIPEKLSQKSSFPQVSTRLFKKLKSEHSSSTFKYPETASSTLMKYFLEHNEAKSQQLAHPVDSFLASIASTFKILDTYHLNVAKTKIFSIVQEIELQQIMHIERHIHSPGGIFTAPLSSSSPGLIYNHSPSSSSTLDPSPSPNPQYTTLPSPNSTVTTTSTWSDLHHHTFSNIEGNSQYEHHNNTSVTNYWPYSTNKQ